MSKNNNVNPGQYKVAGRERPGDDVVRTEHKARLTQARPGTTKGRGTPARDAGGATTTKKSTR